LAVTPGGGDELRKNTPTEVLGVERDALELLR
jgi:hypothetical protein